MIERPLYRGKITALSVIGGGILIALLIAGGLYLYSSQKVQKDITLSPGIHIYGNPKAPVRVSVYTDFECPHCKKFHESHMGSLIQKFGGQIVFVYKNFPRSEHPGAREKAEAAECVYKKAGAEAYWKYVAKLFEREPREYTNDVPDAPYLAATAIGVDKDTIRTCVTAHETAAIVDADLAEVNEIGGLATPFIYVTGNGKEFLIQGDRGSETNTAIREALGS